MDNDHDLRHTDDPDGVAQRVHDLAARLVPKGSIPSKADSQVAVGHQGIGNPYAKLQL